MQDVRGQRALAALYTSTVPETVPSDENLALHFTNAVSSLKALRSSLDNSRYVNGRGELPYLDAVAAELETMRKRTAIEWWSVSKREIIVRRTARSKRTPAIAAPGRHGAPLTSHCVGPTLLMSLVVESVGILAAIGLNWPERHAAVNALVRLAGFKGYNDEESLRTTYRSSHDAIGLRRDLDAWQAEYHSLSELGAVAFICADDIASTGADDYIDS